MARALLGVALSDLRGKVGGVVFQRSAQGTTLRSLTTPINPASPTQETNRAAMFQLQIAWQTLSEDVRTSWDAWAIYQNIRIGTFASASSSGQQAFIQLNRYRLLLGQALITAPTFTPYSLESSTLIVNSVAGTLTIQFDTQTDADDYRPIVSLSFVLPPARNARPSVVRFMVPDANVNPTTWTITAAYTTAFGQIPGTGQRLYAIYGLQDAVNGALSIFTRGVVIVNP